MLVLGCSTSGWRWLTLEDVVSEEWPELPLTYATATLAMFLSHSMTVVTVADANVLESQPGGGGGYRVLRHCCPFWDRILWRQVYACNFLERRGGRVKLRMNVTCIAWPYLEA